MEPAAAHTLYDVLAGERSGFLYSGSFPDAHTARLIALGEALLNARAARRDEQNKLAFVMVEAYQNIIRHRARDMAHDPPNGRSMFLLHSEEAAQHVIAVNPVCRKETPGLTALLDRLHGLDRTELKELFLRGLQAQGPGKRGGAGLGLIEMARRSGHGLKHALLPLDDQLELFALHVTLGASKSEGPVGLDEALRAHALVVEHGIVLAHAGVLPTTAFGTLLRIVEEEAPRPPGSLARAYLAAIDHLTTGPVRGDDHLVALSHKQGELALLIGQWVPAGRTAAAVAEVSAIADLDSARLSQAYRAALLERARGGVQTGTGLLDLARHALAPLAHHVLAFPDGRAFLSIKAVI